MKEDKFIAEKSICHLQFDPHNFLAENDELNIFLSRFWRAFVKRRWDIFISSSTFVDNVIKQVRSRLFQALLLIMKAIHFRQQTFISISLSYSRQAKYLFFNLSRLLTKATTLLNYYFNSIAVAISFMYNSVDYF